MRIALLSGIVAVSFVCTATAAPYRNAANKYSLTLPDGWIQVPDAELRNLSAKLFASGGKVKFDTAFQVQGRPWFEYPYAMVQVIPYPSSGRPNVADMRLVVDTMTRAAIDQASQQLTPEAKQFVDPRKVAPGKPQFDEKSHSFRWTMDADYPGIGKVTGVMRGQFGRSALVQILCYARKEDLPRHQATFDKLCASLTFDESARYDSGGLPAWFQGPLKWGIIGGVIGGVVGVLGWMMRKRQQPPTYPPMQPPMGPPGYPPYRPG